MRHARQATTTYVHTFVEPNDLSRSSIHFKLLCSGQESDHVCNTGIYYTIDRILCSPFSCPVMEQSCSISAFSLAHFSFCSLARDLVTITFSDTESAVATGDTDPPSFDSQGFNSGPRSRDPRTSVVFQAFPFKAIYVQKGESSQSQSLLCPATGRLAEDSFCLASWCAYKYRVEEVAVEKHPAT